MDTVPERPQEPKPRTPKDKAPEDKAPESGPRKEKKPRRGQIYHAAYLHYVLNYSQSQIAAEFDVDKGTASRWLATARREKMVTIRVHPPGSEDLEVRLTHCFGLEQVRVRVIPGMPSRATRDPRHTLEHTDLYALQSEELGRAAAEMIGPRLVGNTGIGLAGGRGVAAFAAHLVDHCPMVGFKLFALGVSGHEPFPISASSVTAIAHYSLVTEFQERAQRNLNRDGPTVAPEVVGSALRLPVRPDNPGNIAAAADKFYDEALEGIHHVIAGVGDMDDCYVLDSDERKKMRKQGAVGEVVYNVYGEHGTPIQVDPSVPVYSFGIRRLRNLVAQGGEVTIICKDKIQAIYHLLTAKPLPEDTGGVAEKNTGIVTGIVTDMPTAHSLLELYERRPR